MAYKIPPQNIEAEQSVLGAMLLDKEAVINVAGWLKSEYFYEERHGVIYSNIVELFEEGQPIDIITLTNKLKGKKQLSKIGGRAYLTELVNMVPTSAHVEEYGEIVKDNSVRRGLITSASQITELGFDEGLPLKEVIDEAEKLIFSAAQTGVKTNFVHIKDLLKDAYERAERADTEGTPMGIPSGLRDLDNIIGGFQKSDLIIVAARPSVGKSSFALSLLKQSAVVDKQKTLIFSLEMSSSQILDRLLGMQAEVSFWDTRTGKLNDEMFERLAIAMGELAESQILIDDTPGQHINEIRTKARRIALERGVDIIMVDYLQLVHGSSKEGRTQEVAEISQGLKNIARELNVPVIALSQLSRAVESRSSRRPQLSDLRDSGCLTGDTFIVDAKSGRRMRMDELSNRKKQVPISVFGLNEDLSVSEHKMVKVFSSGKKVVYELKTRSGRKIKASSNHPFFTVDGWRRLDELRIGDSIGTARSLDLGQNYSEKLMNDNEIILLAHLLGDGCILPKQPYHYTSEDLENLQYVDSSSRKLFGIESRLVKQGNWYHLYLPSPYRLTKNTVHPITEWFKKLGIDRVRSFEKVLPEIIFRLNPSSLSLLLKHLWATDGNISWLKKKSGGIKGISTYYATSSIEFAYQLQHLLVRFGIQSTVSTVKNNKGYRDMYHLVISESENQIRFLTRIGCVGKRGGEISDMVDYLSNVSPNPNLDVIPSDIWQFIKVIKDFVGVSWRALAQDLNISYNGSAMIKSGISRSRMSKIYSVLPFEAFKNLAQSDVYWDRVVSVKKLGVEEVYDATVEGVHNFIANDFIVHNSIEQDADLVIFIDREETYNPDTERKGIADVIVAKHRNGPTGDVELAFVKNIATFKTLYRERSEK